MIQKSVALVLDGYQFLDILIPAFGPDRPHQPGHAAPGIWPAKPAPDTKTKSHRIAYAKQPAHHACRSGNGNDRYRHCKPPRGHPSRTPGDLRHSCDWTL